MKTGKRNFYNKSELSYSQWRDLEFDYITGLLNRQEICKKYSVTYSILDNWIHHHRLSDRREEFKTQILNRCYDMASDIIAKRQIETKNLRYEHGLKTANLLKSSIDTISVGDKIIERENIDLLCKIAKAQAQNFDSMFKALGISDKFEIQTNQNSNSNSVEFTNEYKKILDDIESKRNYNEI